VVYYKHKEEHQTKDELPNFSKMGIQNLKKERNKNDVRYQEFSEVTPI